MGRKAGVRERRDVQPGVKAKEVGCYKGRGGEVLRPRSFGGGNSGHMQGALKMVSKGDAKVLLCSAHQMRGEQVAAEAGVIS